jgi:hypothetical protein
MANIYSKINILVNPCIFTLDIKQMQEQYNPFCEELCKYVFSPERVKRYLELFNYNITTDEYEEDTVTCNCL